MKKILFALTALLSANAVSAQQVLSPPVVQETFYPGSFYGGELETNNSLGHMNAYSRGDIDIDGQQSDLYVYTWDDGENDVWLNAISASGFAVRQYSVGIPANSSTTPLHEDYKLLDVAGQPKTGSVEAGILRSGQQTFIMVTYVIESSTSPTAEYIVDLYEWQGAAGLSPTPIFSYTIPLANNFQKGWIHQDVNQDTKAVITYEYEGRIYALAAEIAGSSLDFYGSYDLDESHINTFELQRPDVAMQFMMDENRLEMYYTFTNSTNQELFVVKGLWDDLVAGGISTSYMGSVPVDLLDHNSSLSDAYDLPRIDAVDIANTPDERNWSVVVSESFSTPLQKDLIFTTYGLYNLSLNNRYLNNNSIAPNQSLDISIPFGSTYSSYFYNKRPVVAFSQQKDEMYYGWCFRDDDYISAWYGFSPANYISLKLRTDGSILNYFDPSIFNPLTFTSGMHTFARINDNITIGGYNMYPRRAIAFSTENHTSPQLFTAFFQTQPLDEHNYFIAQKTTDWTTAQFRPAVEAEQKQVAMLSIYPNPTNDFFVLKAKGEASFSLEITDYIGRSFGNYNGKIESINNYLKTVNLASGLYIFNLIDDQNRSQSINAIKQ